MHGKDNQQTSGKKAQTGVSCEDAETRIIRGLAQINTDQGTTIGLVSKESEKPEAYACAGRSIRSYTEHAEVEDIFAEEARLIARAKAEGFFWENAQVIEFLVMIGTTGGGTEHDVFLFSGKAPLIIRSTILDSYGFKGRSPAQYLKRLADYNAIFHDLQTRMIGVSLNARGNGVIWTAQPFVEGTEFKDDKLLQKEMESRGWERIDRDYDENIVYKHTQTGVVIRDVHSGNVLKQGKEIYPIDVIVTEQGHQALLERARLIVPMMTLTQAAAQTQHLSSNPQAREAEINRLMGYSAEEALALDSQRWKQFTRACLFSEPNDILLSRRCS